jgi:hypothetical protein
LDPADYAEYCKNHGVATFLLPALKEDGSDSNGEDPDEMHCVLDRFGSIYMVGPREP